MQIKILIAIVLILFSGVTKAQENANDIVGTWLTPGKEPAKVQIYKSGERFYGKIIWLQNAMDKDLP